MPDDCDSIFTADPDPVDCNVPYSPNILSSCNQLASYPNPLLNYQTPRRSQRVSRSGFKCPFLRFQTFTPIFFSSRLLFYILMHECMSFPFFTFFTLLPINLRFLHDVCYVLSAWLDKAYYFHYFSKLTVFCLFLFNCMVWYVPFYLVCLHLKQISFTKTVTFLDICLHFKMLHFWKGIAE